MTKENIQSELDRQPFRPLRLHLVSGKFVDIRTPAAAFMLDHAVMIFRRPRPEDDESDRYDIIAIRGIEWMEQL